MQSLMQNQRPRNESGHKIAFGFGRGTSASSGPPLGGRLFQLWGPPRCPLVAFKTRQNKAAAANIWPLSHWQDLNYFQKTTIFLIFFKVIREDLVLTEKTLTCRARLYWNYFTDWRSQVITEESSYWTELRIDDRFLHITVKWNVKGVLLFWCFTASYIFMLLKKKRDRILSPSK